jgi:hypothetical protein
MDQMLEDEEEPAKFVTFLMNNWWMAMLYVEKNLAEMVAKGNNLVTSMKH